MRNKVIMSLIPIIAASFIFVSNAQASEEANEMGLIAGHATAYCLTGTTASGTYTRDGVCASCSSRLGKTIILYQRLPDGSVGKQIGIYECEDTGGTEGLHNGTVIDVWRSDKEQAHEFMELLYEDGCKGKVYIQVLDAEG